MSLFPYPLQIEWKALIFNSTSFFSDDLSQRWHLKFIAHSIPYVLICTYTQFLCCLNNRHKCVFCLCSFLCYGLKASISFSDLCFLVGFKINQFLEINKTV